MEEVLMAFVRIDGLDPVCSVRASDVGKALIALHGEPKQGMKVVAKIEYALRPLADVLEMEEFDRLGLDHGRSR